MDKGKGGDDTSPEIYEAAETLAKELGREDDVWALLNLPTPGEIYMVKAKAVDICGPERSRELMWFGHKLEDMFKVACEFYLEEDRTGAKK